MAVEHSLKLKLPLLLLVAFIHSYCAAAREEAAGIQVVPKNCKRRCGHVSIEYPFGTTKECSLDTKFLINCTNNNVPYLQDQDNDLPLLSISLDEGEIRVSLPVASDCYYTNSNSKKKGHFFNNETDQGVFLENYSISTSRNVFTTLGCRTLGLVLGRSYYSEEDEIISTQAFPKACLSYCEENSVFIAKDGECKGTGCCNTTVPEDSQGHGLSLMSYFFENSVLNNSQVIDYNPCGYAFLVENNGTYNFETAHLHKLENTSFPVVLDWTVGENQTCEGAKKNHSTYACKAQYSTCVDSKKRPGYLCKCLPGFQGNPYLHYHGCKDIDECKEANKFCVEEATCRNLFGSYRCVCPEGYIGNGKIHANGNETVGCTPRPPPLEINIVNTKTPKQHNRQKTALLFVSVSILALFLVIFNVYCGLKKRKLNKIKQRFFQQNGGLLLQQKIAKQKGSIETVKIFSIEELKKATNNFDEGKILGRGGYGIVYKGVLQDNTTVAIKKSKISDQSQIEQFINEVVSTMDTIHEAESFFMAFENMINKKTHNIAVAYLTQWSLDLNSSSGRGFGGRNNGGTSGKSRRGGRFQNNRPRCQFCRRIGHAVPNLARIWFSKHCT